MSKSNTMERFGDILDYVCWRGDISFAEDPWNEVDSLIMATIVYSNFVPPRCMPRATHSLHT